MLTKITNDVNNNKKKKNNNDKKNSKLIVTYFLLLNKMLLFVHCLVCNLNLRVTQLYKYSKY